MATSTTGRSRKSGQKTSMATSNITFSRASAAGRSRSNSRDGRTTGRAGPALRPANRSRRRASVKDSPTSAISGRRGSGSSAGAALALFLANRLEAGTALPGSILFRVTWKERVTPSGRSISALRAQALRTFVNGCTSWPTPRTPTGGPESAKRKKELGRKNSGGGDLQAAALLTGWPSPMAGSPASKKYNEAGNNDSSRRTVSLARWNSPRATDGGRPPRRARRCDPTRKFLEGRTPNAREAAASGPTPDGSSAATASTGPSLLLNPKFSAWLQGFPPAWDRLAPKGSPSRGRRRGASHV